jgi:hypothetical protein
VAINYSQQIVSSPSGNSPSTPLKGTVGGRSLCGVEGEHGCNNIRKIKLKIV